MHNQFNSGVNNKKIQGNILVVSTETDYNRKLNKYRQVKRACPNFGHFAVK